MKFTIGTVSSSPNLTEDLKLIKSSILYADEIELIGMMEYALYKYMPANVFGAKDLESIIPAWILFIESIHPEGGETMVQKLEYTHYDYKSKRFDSNELTEGIKNLLLVGGLAAISKEFTTGFLKIANMYNQSRIEVNEKKDVAKKNVMYYYYLASKL